MADNYHVIEELILKHLRQEITDQEQIVLNEWLATSEKNKALFEQLNNKATLELKLNAFHKLELEKDEVRKRLLSSPLPRQTALSRQTDTRNKGAILRTFWSRIAVAASIAGVLGITGYFLLFDKATKNEITKSTLSKDVEAPKGTKAMITLADGRTVALDSVTSGTLATQGNVQVIKNANGEIVYSGTDSREVAYNTLHNPRGSNIVNLTLGDGTKVWLNSESSLKYPTAFIENTRSVEITGEAYFEVARNASKKFIVSANGVTTEVLGTHFNVNSYADEGNVKVTLLEGSVNVRKNNESNILKPGQQAKVDASGALVIENNVNTEEVMAWKNGLFSFKATDIKIIMQQVSRWYDVEVVFEKEINEKFYAKVSRTTNASTLFKMLESTNAVHFRIEGKKVTVTR